METYTTPPLQREWEEYNRLQEEGQKLCNEGWKLWEERKRLKEKEHKLREEGDKLWKEAIIKYYGKDAKVKWRTWNKDNKPTCHINGDVYV